ncbi:hypothetical protein BY996DRAFT_6947173 [Phakopsora pachyrhizi]|nr:hypothetical protein BY996DRAFT_6947173 [Phakopsora pachyrhizi]
MKSGFVPRFSGSTLNEDKASLNWLLKNQTIGGRPQKNIHYIEINEQGCLTRGRVTPRVAFCADKGIQMKDLRLIDSTLYGPSITAKNGALIFNIMDFQGLATSDTFVLFEEDQEAQEFNLSNQILKDNNFKTTNRNKFAAMFIQKILINKSNEINKESSLPISRNGSVSSSSSLEKENCYGRFYKPKECYKTIALSIILEIFTKSLEDELYYLRDSTSKLLNELHKKIEIMTFKKLLVFSHQLNAFSRKCWSTQCCIDRLSEEYENPFLNSMDSNESKEILRSQEKIDIENLLEFFSLERLMEEANNIMVLSYFHIYKMILIFSSKLFFSLIQANSFLLFLKVYIKIMEEAVALTITSNQICLVGLDLKIAIITCGLTAGSVIAGILGMNLKNGIEDSRWAFVVLCAVIGSLVSFIITLGWRKLNRSLKQ